MSDEAWTLEQNAECEILLPWREQEPDSEVEARVLEYVAGLLRDPFRSLLEDPADSGVFSLEAVPGTNVSLGWTLNMTTKEVVLFHVG